MAVTVVIHTQNEEENITDAIKSAGLLTDKIVVIDMDSRDKTVDIVNKLNIPVFKLPDYHYVEPAREFGIKQSKTDWVFILDADERIDKELATEIKSTIAKAQFSYYKVPRKNFWAGIKWLQYGGWYPDFQTRLINKKYFLSWPKQIHSTPQIKGNSGYLKSPLKHNFHGNLQSMVDKTIIFENIESDLLFHAKKKAAVRTFFRKYFAELYRRLIRYLGFLDGPFGIIEALYQAFSKTITYLFLYEKQK